MKIRINFVIALLLISPTVFASDIKIVPPTLWQSITEKIAECTWHPTCYFSKKLGSTVTTINSTDQISSSRTTINDNFSALNNGKIENASTTLNSVTTLPNLSSIGTITTGVWTGTTLAAANGGTGSTTLSAFHVLLGSSTNPIGIVDGIGTSGQFLTSQGAGVPPVWQSASVDQTQNYTWTGTHHFATSTTFIGASGPGGLVPAGTVLNYASTTAPAGYLLCDGTSYPTATYPNLFTAIGYGFGGSGANFNVPDARGRSILMASTTANIAQKAGESNHTQSIAEMPAHTHGISPFTTSAGGPSSVAADVTQNNATAVNLGQTDSTGGGLPFNVLDPYIVMQMIIKY